MTTSSLLEPRLDAAPPAAKPRPVVCHVVHTLGMGGAEVLATRIARRLGDRYQAVFACLDDGGILADDLLRDEVPVTVLHRRGGLDFRCAKKLSTWLQRHNVSVVHAHQVTPLSYALLARLHRSHPRIVFTEHGRFYPDRTHWKRHLLQRCLLRKTDRIVAVGRSVAQALVQYERLPEMQIRVVHNGMPLGRKPASSRATTRARLGCSDTTFVVLQIARLDPIKDHCLALDSLRIVCDRFPDCQLWLAGDGPERTAILERIDQLRLHTQVRLLGERNDVPDLLAASDAVLLTSRSEGIPLVLIEAMAAGVPVVATAVGGIPELITHGREGLLCDTRRPDALADLLLQLARSPALREELGRGGEERALDFDESKMIEQYATLYDEVLAAP